MNGKYYWIGVLLTVAALFATIAPMVAARNHDVDFIVLMAGSGVPGADILVEQTLLISEASGVSKEEAEKKATEERELLGFVIKDRDSPTFKQDLHNKLAGEVKEPQLGTQVAALTSPCSNIFWPTILGRLCGR